MNASCAASGPEKDRWALREMIDSLPFQEIQRICDGCLRSSWHRIVEQAAFTEELAGLENRDHGFLACSDTTVSFTLPFGGPKRKFLIELLHGGPIALKHAPSSLQNGIELFIADADRRFFSDFEIFGDALTQRALANPRTT